MFLISVAGRMWYSAVPPCHVTSHAWAESENNLFLAIVGDDVDVCVGILLLTTPCWWEQLIGASKKLCFGEKGPRTNGQCLKSS